MPFLLSTSGTMRRGEDQVGRSEVTVSDPPYNWSKFRLAALWSR